MLSKSNRRKRRNCCSRFVSNIITLHQMKKKKFPIWKMWIGFVTFFRWSSECRFSFVDSLLFQLNLQITFYYSISLNNLLNFNKVRAISQNLLFIKFLWNWLLLLHSFIKKLNSYSCLSLQLKSKYVLCLNHFQKPATIFFFANVVELILWWVINKVLLVNYVVQYFN